MEYLIEGRKFSISYGKLREHYILFCEMSDEEFMKNIAGALHLACIICFFKELPSSMVLGDLGIIHELAHLIHVPNEPLVNLLEIRQKFKTTLELV